MPNVTWAKVPALGVGMTYLPGLERLLGAAEDLLGFLEIEPETLWEARKQGGMNRNPAAHSWLKTCPFPILLHGVSSAIGGTRPLSYEHATELRADCQALRPAWVSEHLAFQSYLDGNRWQPTGFFLPPVQSEPSVQLAAAHLRQRQTSLQLPIAFETGVSYLRKLPNELPDGVFWSEVAEQADCGILLDLHNIWTNARNGRDSVQEVLDALPLHRVVELHIAGGEELQGYWLDAHTQLAPQEVLSIAAELIPQLPSLRAINLELLSEGIAHHAIQQSEILEQLDQLRELWELRPKSAEQALPRSQARSQPRIMTQANLPVARKAAELPHPEEWECSLGRLVHRREPSGLYAAGSGNELANDPGIPLLRELIDSARRGQLVAALPLCFRELFARQEGSAAARVERYLHACLPQASAFEEAEAFVTFASKQGWLLSAALARFDITEREVQIEATAREIESPYNLAPLVECLRAGERPRERPKLTTTRLILEPLAHDRV